jgi:hypothetical protein
MNENFALLAVTLPVLFAVGFGNISIEGSYSWQEHTSTTVKPKVASIPQK